MVIMDELAVGWDIDIGNWSLPGFDDWGLNWDYFTDSLGEWFNVWTADSIDTSWGWFYDNFVESWLAGLILVLNWGIAWIGDSALWALIVDWGSDLWDWYDTYGDTAKEYVNSFLDYIHFDTLKDLHDIGYIVWEDYREVINEFYKGVSEWSGALGLDASFVTLALSDARNLIMDVGSLTGHSYDINELTWVNELTGFMQEVEKKSSDYEENPGYFLIDLQQWFDADYVQAKSSFQLNLFGVIKEAAGFITDNTTKLEKLKEDLEQAVLHLPESISRPIYEKLDKGFKAFDSLIEDTINPTLVKLEGVGEVLSGHANRTEGHLDVIDNLMANPGTLLTNINQLPEIQRLEQEAQISEISTRGFSTEAQVRNKEIDDSDKELDLIADALIKDRKPLDFLSLEYEGTPKTRRKAYGVFTSWQVGDY